MKIRTIFSAILSICLLNLLLADGEIKAIPVTPSDSGQLFSWIKRGVLMRVWIEETNESIYYYRNEEGGSELLTGSLAGLSGMIIAEAKGARAEEIVIVRKLPAIFASLFSRKTERLINGAYVEEYRESFIPPADREARLKMLGELAGMLDVRIGDSRWTSRFFVHASTGEVFEWKVEGRFGFHIDRLEVTAAANRMNIPIIRHPPSDPDRPAGSIRQDR